MAKLVASRRSFLKLAAVTGAAALAAGTIKPGVLHAEEVGEEEDELQMIRSNCRACGKMECVTWVWVQNGRVVNITGDETSKTSRGNLCGKGKSAMQQLYHPDRIKYPMKRTNPKGEDPGWVRISWDEAIQIAANSLQEIIDKYGGPAIRTYHGTSRITTITSMVIGLYLGTPNAGCTAGQVCKGPRESAGQMMCYQAHWTALSENPKIFFQWGTNQEVSNYDNACRVTVDAQNQAEHSIVVGPRLQNLGKECEYWLPIRPGTDDALAHCFLNIILNEMKSYDTMFLKRWSNAAFLAARDMEPTGFDWSFTARSGEYPLQIQTRLLKESDLIEGGNPRRFIAWDTVSNSPIYYDADTIMWEGETEFNEVKEFEKIGKCYLPKDPGFGANIDPALEGEYQITLKDGTVVTAKPVLQELADHVAEWTPERTAEYCWLDADKIREVGELYGKELMAGPVIYNLAPEHTGNAMDSNRSFLTLSSIMGNLDGVGGNRGGEPVQEYYHIGFNMAGPYGAPPMDVETQNKVAGFERYPLLPWIRTLGGAAMHYDQTSATDMTLTGEPYPIRAMLSATGNHFHSGNATKNWEGIKSLDFFWCSELWHIPMLELADLATPATHFLENEILRPSQGAECGLSIQRRCVEPLGECWRDQKQHIACTKEMGIPWWPTDKESAPPWFPEEWLDVKWPDEQQTLELSCIPMTTGMIPPGPEGKQILAEDWADMVRQFQENGQWNLQEYSPWGYYKRFMLGWMRNSGFKPGFDTPTGLFEIWSTICESYHPGHELPLVHEPYESPYSTPEVYEEYPIIYTSGKRIPVYFHSEGRMVPFTREQAVVPTFQINPETAAELGIEDGDWCWIESQRGKIREVASLFYGIAPGVIECEHAWWYPELPAPTHGWNLSNVNVMVDEYAQDPIIGATALRAYLVKVYKATPENSPYGNPVPCADEDGTPIIADVHDERLKNWMPVYE